jgi:hypothetical protein
MTQQRPVKRPRPARTENLPEPARSLGRKVAKENVRPGEPAAPSDEQAAEQMEEWVASRAPTARRSPPSR